MTAGQGHHASSVRATRGTAIPKPERAKRVRRSLLAKTDEMAAALRLRYANPGLAPPVEHLLLKQPSENFAGHVESCHAAEQCGDAGAGVQFFQRRAGLDRGLGMIGRGFGGLHQ